MGLVQYLDVLVNKAKAEQLKADLGAMGKQGGDSMARGIAEASRQVEAQQQTTWQKIKGFVGGFAQGAKEEFQKVNAASDDAARKSEQSGGLMSRAWGGVKGQIAALGATIGAVFAARSIYNFLSDSIKGADEAAHAWGGLAQAVDNTGGSWAKVGPEITNTLKALGDRYLFDPDDLAASMQKVTTATGSSATALRVMETAAALARKSGMSLGEASDLLTRALVTGQTRGLAPWVGSLKGSSDVLGDVNARLGDVMSTMTPMEQAQARLALAWDDLKDTLGAALVTIIDTSGIMPVLSEGVKALTGWISENREGIGRWADWIIHAVKIGVIPVWGNLVAAFNLVKASWYGLEAVFYAGAAVWDTLKLGVVDLARTVTSSMITVVGAMEKGARALGLPMADALHASVAQMTRDYNALSITVTQTTNSQAENNRKATEAGQKMAAALNAANDSATNGWLKAGDAVHDWREGVETDSEGASVGLDTTMGAGADAVVGHMGRMAAGSVGKVKEISAAAKRSAQEMSDAYAAYAASSGSSILAGQKQVVDFYKEVQKASAQTAEEMKATNDIVMSEYIRSSNQATAAILQGHQQQQQAIHETRDAFDAVTDAMHDGSRTYNTDTVPSILKGSGQIDRSLDEQARAADGVTEAFRGGEQYYVNTAVPGILQGSGRVAKAQVDAAATTKVTWTDALNVLQGVMQGLASTVGGIFGDISKVTGSLVGGIGSIASAIKAVSGAGGGLLGTLTKITGALGGIGGAIGVISTVVGVVGGFFHRNKDPGRMSSNDEAYRAALGGDADALDFLKAHAFAAVGGGAGWASNAAQMDATEKWISALRKGAIAGDKDALAQLRTIYAKLGSAGFVEYKDWAEAERRAIPQGIPGFAIGGMVPRTGLIQAEIGEAVLSPWLTASLRQVLGVAGGLGGQTRATNYQNTASVVINFYGVQDRDIPQRTVDALQAHMGVSFKRQSALQGNTQMPN